MDLRSLSDEVRFRFFNYLWGRGVRSSELGIDPTYANKVKNRRARVSDALLERMLRILSVDEFAMLVGSTTTHQALQQLTVREPQSLGEAAIALDQYVRGLELVLERYPQLSNIAYQRLMELLKSRVRGYLDLVAPGLYKLESYYVRPYDDKARDLVRSALEEAVEELAGRAQQLALRLRSPRPGNRAKAIGGTLKLAEMLRSAIEVARSHMGEIEELGLAGVESKLGGALELLEGALGA